MDVSRVVELRVHGVSGTPPQDLLDRPLVTQVAGDGIAGFYRPRLASERTDAVPGRDGPPLEGYSWGGLTSGSPGRALWLVLLPFTLINVAPRLRPGDPPGGPTRGSARLVWWLWYLSRLLALSLTMTLVVAFCGIGLDLLGWQCADPSRPCAAGSPGWLIGRVSELAPGPRLAVGALVPLLVLAALALISGRTIARYEAVSDQARRDDNPRATEPQLDSAWMWRGEDLVRRLRHLHLQAGLAVVLAAVAWPIESWWRVVVLLVAAGAAGCAVALLSRSSVYGRGPNVPWVSRVIWAIWAVLGGITVSTAVLLLTSAVSFTHRSRPPHPVTAVGLPHYAGTLIWFFTAQLVLVVGLTVVALSLRRAGLVAAPAGPRPGVWGIGTLVLTLLGVFTGAVLSASAYIYAGAWLHTGSVKPSFQQATSVAAAFDVPESIRDASLTFAVSGAFVVVIAVFAAAMGAVRYALVRPGSRPLTGHEFADDYPGVSTATGRAKQIVRAFWRARLIDGVGSAVGLLLLPGTLLTLAVTVLLLLRPWSSWAAHHADVLTGRAAGWLPTDQAFSAAYLQAFGAYAVVLLMLGLVTLGALAYRVPKTRRLVGIVWDLASFWPRSAHPLAAPCYAERSVPDLTTRIRWYVEGSDPSDYPTGAVVLAGHSQGSVISAAVLLQLQASDRQRAQPDRVLPRLAFLSYGSVLRRLYARYFPAYLGAGILDQVAGVLGADGVMRWRNLWRHSDPIGGAVAMGPPGTGRAAGGPIAQADCKLIDPRFDVPAGDTSDPAVLGHSGYPDDPIFQQSVADLAMLL